MATNKPFKYYIELYLAKISFSYNMVKNALPDDGIKFLIKQIDRFPDLKKWIIGPDSFLMFILHAYSRLKRRQSYKIKSKIAKPIL